jgi:hypothetical protein
MVKPQPSYTYFEIFSKNELYLVDLKTKERTNLLEDLSSDTLSYIFNSLNLQPPTEALDCKII